eukprot:GHVS01094987.1.p1 GENE.GHVS01094987.1~~GHVS01094987.1.p1  ORF type:complete len:533 (+),score=126.96 GHVS01094987.1:910-2508(+)
MYIVETLGYTPDKILLFGRSIGTGPAAWLAAVLNKHRIPIAGLVLQSPYTSLSDVASELVQPKLAGVVAKAIVELSNHWDVTKCVESLSNVPLLIIHGQMDRTISCRQGQSLLDSCGAPKSMKIGHFPLAADHSTFCLEEDILRPLKDLINISAAPSRDYHEARGPPRSSAAAAGATRSFTASSCSRAASSSLPSKWFGGNTQRRSCSGRAQTVTTSVRRHEVQDSLATRLDVLVDVLLDEQSILALSTSFPSLLMQPDSSRHLLNHDGAAAARTTSSLGPYQVSPSWGGPSSSIDDLFRWRFPFHNTAAAAAEPTMSPLNSQSLLSFASDLFARSEWMSPAVPPKQQHRRRQGAWRPVPQAAVVVASNNNNNNNSNNNNNNSNNNSNNSNNNNSGLQTAQVVCDPSRCIQPCFQLHQQGVRSQEGCAVVAVEGTTQPHHEASCCSHEQEQGAQQLISNRPPDTTRQQASKRQCPEGLHDRPPPPPPQGTVDRAGVNTIVQPATRRFSWIPFLSRESRASQQQGQNRKQSTN